MTRLSAWKRSAASLCLALLLAAPLPSVAASSDEGPPLPIKFGGPFSLTDHHGERRTDEDFRGRFLLIYFGYTYCPDICPTNLTTMSHALEALGDKAEGVQPLFVSIDPARDTVEVLADYVDHFYPTMVGLTGTETEIRAVAKAYRVHRSKVVFEKDAPADEYLVNHSSITFLMGRDGEFLSLFPHDTKAEVMTKALEGYLGRADTSLVSE